MLRSPYIGNDLLTPARYQQMIGRAGRAGFDTHGESIMIVKPNEIKLVTDQILLAPTIRVDSQLSEDNARGLQQLILSLISLDLGGKDRKSLAETMLHCTLLGQQVCIKLNTIDIDNLTIFFFFLKLYTEFSSFYCDIGAC